MTKEPSQSEMNKPKKVNNKEYFWCKTHKSYGRHKNADCKGLGLKGAELKTKAETPQSQVNEIAKQQLKLSKALEAVMKEEEE
jgi:hypothetical protein